MRRGTPSVACYRPAGTLQAARRASAQGLMALLAAVCHTRWSAHLTGSPAASGRPRRRAPAGTGHAAGRLAAAAAAGETRIPAEVGRSAVAGSHSPVAMARLEAQAPAAAGSRGLEARPAAEAAGAVWRFKDTERSTQARAHPANASAVARHPDHDPCIDSVHSSAATPAKGRTCGGG
eukprot:357435-Chlamydomonas_euryale.AAC.9